MLRITPINGDPGAVCLMLEGRLVGDWVGVLESELAAREEAAPALVLDLSHVDFANGAGVAVLRAARARGVRVRGCSPLLSSLLGGVS